MRCLCGVKRIALLGARRADGLRLHNFLPRRFLGRKGEGKREVLNKVSTPKRNLPSRFLGTKREGGRDVWTQDLPNKQPTAYCTLDLAGRDPEL